MGIPEVSEWNPQNSYETEIAKPLSVNAQRLCCMDRDVYYPKLSYMMLSGSTPRLSR